MVPGDGASGGSLKQRGFELALGCGEMAQVPSLHKQSWIEREKDRCRLTVVELTICTL